MAVKVLLPNTAVACPARPKVSRLLCDGVQRSAHQAGSSALLLLVLLALLHSTDGNVCYSVGRKQLSSGTAHPRMDTWPMDANAESA